MSLVDLEAVTVSAGPARVSKVLGPLGGFEGRSVSDHFALTSLGANVETLAPGSASSHRHWHSHVDEIVVVLSGKLVLVEDGGTVAISAGEIAVFPAGQSNGHCMRNESDALAQFFVVASCDARDRCHYADADLIAEPDGTLRQSDGTVIA